MRVPIGISNRHLHLSKQDAERLFGKGYQLQVKKKLSQPGEFAAEEILSIKGSKGIMENVRVVGPYRSQTQVEIMQGDSHKLGVQAPIRKSGNLNKSPGMEIIGPKGKVFLSEGVIVSKRHLHITVAESKDRGLKNGEHIYIQVKGERGLIFQNVVVRAKDKYALDFHIDREEANAAGIQKGDWGEIVLSK